MSTTERWQIPVLEDDAAEITRLAKGLGMTQAVMTVHLLEAALESRESVTEWITALLGVGISRSRDVLKGKRRRPAEAQAMTRIEIRIPTKAAREIERMAACIGNTPVRMASLLLRAGLDSNSGIVDVVSQLLKKRIAAKKDRRGSELEAQGGADEKVRKGRTSPG
jgi:hypothetical protein